MNVIFHNNEWRVDLDATTAVVFAAMETARTFMDLVESGQPPLTALHNAMQIEKETHEPKR